MKNTWTEEDSIQLTAALVVLDGHRMSLTTTERITAVRLGVQHGLSRDVIAERIGVTLKTLSKIAYRHHIQLPVLVQPERWAAIVNASATPAAQTARSRRRKQLATAA
jgi:hypothetical protein